LFGFGDKHGAPAVGEERQAVVMFNAGDDAKAEMVRRMEVLAGPGRRRQWSEEAKARIVSEALQASITVAHHQPF
jgi:hypothetical protein